MASEVMPLFTHRMPLAITFDAVSSQRTRQEEVGPIATPVYPFTLPAGISCPLSTGIASIGF